MQRVGPTVATSMSMFQSRECRFAMKRFIISRVRPPALLQPFRKIILARFHRNYSVLALAGESRRTLMKRFQRTGK